MKKRHKHRCALPLCPFDLRDRALLTSAAPLRWTAAAIALQRSRESAVRVPERFRAVAPSAVPVERTLSRQLLSRSNHHTPSARIAAMTQHILGSLAAAAAVLCSPCVPAAPAAAETTVAATAPQAVKTRLHDIHEHTWHGGLRQD